MLDSILLVILYVIFVILILILISPEEKKYIASFMSKYDLEILSIDEIRQILEYKRMYKEAASENAKNFYHNLAEEIRAKHGYSGGKDGSEYIRRN